MFLGMEGAKLERVACSDFHPKVPEWVKNKIGKGRSGGIESDIFGGGRTPRGTDLSQPSGCRVPAQTARCSAGHADSTHRQASPPRLQNHSCDNLLE